MAIGYCCSAKWCNGLQLTQSVGSLYSHQPAVTSPSESGLQIGNWLRSHWIHCIDRLGGCDYLSRYSKQLETSPAWRQVQTPLGPSAGTTTKSHGGPKAHFSPKATIPWDNKTSSMYEVRREWGIHLEKFSCVCCYHYLASPTSDFHINRIEVCRFRML